ncbi:unnamed protein product, partial [Coregonus sp. 'balchen']
MLIEWLGGSIDQRCSRQNNSKAGAEAGARAGCAVWQSSVLQSPVFTKQPGSIVFPVDSQENNREVVFSCEAQGSPSPLYRWKLNGTAITPKSGSHYSLSGGNLRISHLNKDQDAGTYQCLAFNSFGTIVSREASLTFACLAVTQNK